VKEGPLFMAIVRAQAVNMGAFAIEPDESE
jgi:hypothetical protein